MAVVHQILVRLLDGRTQCLQVPSTTVSGEALKGYLVARTGVPLQLQRLVSGCREIRDETLISASDDGIFPSCSLLLRLRGGKGGFGSLLRGAATKAGQKKTNNFDACRDMSGRRLRHVNAEKKLEEWKAEAEERRLEKLAEQFLRKKAKEVRKGSSVAVEKYIEKYMEDSDRCMEQVHESVRKSFDLYEKSKRKVLPSSGPASKRLKTWLGKKKVDESESDDDEEDDDDDADKSVVLDDGNHKEDEGSAGSTSGNRSDPESSDGGSGQSNLEEECGIPNQRCLDVEEGSGHENISSDSDGSTEPKSAFCEEQVTCINISSSLETRLDSVKVHAAEGCIISELESNKQADVDDKVILFPEVALDSTEANLVMQGEMREESVVQKETVPQSCSISKLEEPLDFEKFKSAEEMEDLGMERLKIELQARGLKCGGTLRERAARLFLLKSTPIDKLPKKLFAKPPAAGK
uniref:UPF0667 protein C1orf55 n=1 Tax=Anthurium amnicola TaxID=1678845 RepID=A0A1D1Y4G9_9ARAE